MGLGLVLTQRKAAHTTMYNQDDVIPSARWRWVISCC